jgi:hypothetical protein
MLNTFEGASADELWCKAFTKLQSEKSELELSRGVLAPDRAASLVGLRTNPATKALAHGQP